MNKDKLNIGIFTDTYTPFINGVTTSVLILKKFLEKMGHNVYIVTVNNESLHFKYEEDGRIIRIPGVPTGIYEYRLTGIYPLKVIKEIKKWNLDIIHSQTEFGVGTFARIIAKQLGIPLVHTYHTMYEDYVHYITHGYFNKSSKKIVEHLTLFYCDKTISELIVPTKKAYELFKDKYKVDRNVYVVPSGIELDKFYKENNKELNKLELRKSLGIDKDDFVVLFVGRMGTEKNVELLLQSMKNLKDSCKKLKLLVVGSGPQLEEYMEYVKDNKLDKCVIFTGAVPWDKIQDYYLISDVFTTASTTETQGLTVVEAMASSLPVVAIDDDSFSGTVIDGLNGFIFKNKRDYKRCIIKLYEDRELVKKLSKQARISSEVHSGKYFAERILDVYRIAINNYDNTSIVNKIKNAIRGDNDEQDGDS